MPRVSTRGIVTPSAGDLRDDVVQLATMADTIADGIGKGAYCYRGKGEDREAALNELTIGSLWQDTDGKKRLYKLRTGRWVPLGADFFAGTQAEMEEIDEIREGTTWQRSTGSHRSHVYVDGEWKSIGNDFHSGSLDVMNNGITPLRDGICFQTTNGGNRMYAWLDNSWYRHGTDFYAGSVESRTAFTPSRDGIVWQDTDQGQNTWRWQVSQGGWVNFFPSGMSGFSARSATPPQPNITYSSAPPEGGSDGDIHFQVL